MRTRIIAWILAAVAISTSVIAAEQRRAQFDVPANAETGASQLFVVANGIASPLWSLKVN